MSAARAILKPRHAKPFFAQHPWVFPGAIARLEGDPADGADVALITSEGQFVAHGLYNSQSKIRIRLYSWNELEVLDETLFRARLTRALGLRRDVLRLGGPRQACRLVFSEADGLSGLVVDQYDRWLAVQFTSLALAQRQDILVNLLRELTQPLGIYLRTERGIGQLEGLQQHDGLLGGEVPETPIEIDDAGLKIRVHLTQGQKTGFYLDQRDNRLRAASFAPGRRVLDAFCYTGGFALQAAKAGAESVLALDVSQPALQLAQENADLNGLASIRFEKADVFDRMGELVRANEAFGLVILDPPKFARAAHDVDNALRAYRQLIALALRLLEPDGMLVMCCCSGLIAHEMLLGVLAQASSEVKRPLQILEVRGASADHPVLVSCPETQYLKCVLARAW